MKKDLWLPLISIASGVLPWQVVTGISGRREAWDSEYYFSIAVPVVLVSAFILGYVEPRRPWRWGLYPFAGQLIWALITLGAGSLLLLGVIVFLVLSIIPMYIGKVGAFAGEKIRERKRPNTPLSGPPRMRMR